MATITVTDLGDVLAKMAEGEFVVCFVVKGGADPDAVVTYPTDGTPMTAAATQSVLAGFLKQCPIPFTNDPDANPDDPQYDSNLEWLAAYIRNLVKGQALRGLEKIEADTAVNPMPE